MYYVSSKKKKKKREQGMSTYVLSDVPSSCTQVIEQFDGFYPEICTLRCPIPAVERSCESSNKGRRRNRYHSGEPNISYKNALEMEKLICKKKKKESNIMHSCT